MEVPKKYWWVVLVLVPVAIAALQFGPGWKRGTAAKSPPGIAHVNYGGSQTNVQGNVAFNDVTLILQEVRDATNGKVPEDVEGAVRAAMDAVSTGDFEHAIPLLEAATRATPVESLKNNLAASYLAVGERERARELLAEAAPSSLPTRTAVEHNRRRLQEPGGATLSVWNPTALPEVRAAITRCDDSGGMLTVEVTYANTASTGVWLYVSPDVTYVLDEKSGKTWKAKISSAGHNGQFEAGAEFVSWIKFARDDSRPATLTVAAHSVRRPFENVVCAVDATS